MRLLSDQDRTASTSTHYHRNARTDLLQDPFLYDLEDQPASSMQAVRCNARAELQTSFLPKRDDDTADSGGCSLSAVLRNIFCNFTLSPAMMRKIK